MVFQGELAKVAVPWQVRASVQKENGFPEENESLAAEIQAMYDGLPAVTNEGHDGQIANVVAAIEGKEELLISGEEGRKTLELITGIYQAGHLGEKVSLPLQVGEPFYRREGVLKKAKHFHEKTKSVENIADNEITLGRDYGK